jgi:alpha-L-arabinofuranosidase
MKIKFVVAILFFACVANAQSIIIIKANQRKALIQSAMWGVFFEDINFGADGGLYAELIKNRSFEFPNPLMGWTIQQKNFREGAILLQNRQDSNANQRYLDVNLQNENRGNITLINEGFRGIGVKKNVRYFFSLMYKQTAETKSKFYISLVDTSGNALGDTIFIPEMNDNNWHKQTVSFLSNNTFAKAKLKIELEGNGNISLDMLSLFPSDTWKNRPGGLRGDMVQMLADLKPGFIRFPGGCIVEGRDLKNRYQWKNTVASIEDRKLIMNRWNVEFSNRLTPDYFQSFGLGFFEYFQLCEDLGALPLPILNCGMACQFNTAEVAEFNKEDVYVQDALDLIEFANGEATTTWGKVRASYGHPAPFNLKILGIGNENWGPQYLQRVALFTKAIKNKYPEIKLVNSSGTDPDGERFDKLNNELRKRNADVIDEHYYRAPSWFLANVNRYDNYPRIGSKVFAGEYAAHSNLSKNPVEKNNWDAALAEAAFMTGLERNADVVCMASYAPLFANADAWQWTPDLIWVNNLSVYATPNYYVQQLFSLNKGDVVVPALLNNKAIEGQDSLYATSCIDTAKNELIIKAVNVATQERNCDFIIEGVKNMNHQLYITTLKSDSLTQVNSFSNPEAIYPAISVKKIRGNKIGIMLPAQSFIVCRMKYN